MMKKFFAVLFLCLFILSAAYTAAAAMSATEFINLCKSGVPHEIEAAIKAGADVKAKNHSDVRDVTILMWVASDGSPEVVAALIKAGVDVNAKDEYGKTALMYAAERNRNPEVITVLFKTGADVKARDNDGKRAVDYASENEGIKGEKAYQELSDASK